MWPIFCVRISQPFIESPSKCIEWTEETNLWIYWLHAWRFERKKIYLLPQKWVMNQGILLGMVHVCTPKKINLYWTVFVFLRAIRFYVRDLEGAEKNWWNNWISDHLSTIKWWVPYLQLLALQQEFPYILFDGWWFSEVISPGNSYTLA